MVSRRGLLGGAAFVGVGAFTGVMQSAGTAAADAPLNTPFTPVTAPHLAEAERMVHYQRLLAAGYLPGGLLGHWPLDGTTADRSGRDHPVTLGSSASWSALRAGGELTFDGTSNAYATTASVLDTTAPFTVSAWLRLADGDSPADLENMYTAVSQDGTNASRFLLQYDPEPRTWAFKVRSEDQSTKVSAVANTPATLGVWTHLTGVWDGTQIHLYVNGEWHRSTATTLSWASTQGFNIGRAKWDGAYVNRFKGSVDDVRAYGRALSADEVSLISGRTAGQNNQYLVNASSTVTWGTPDDLTSWIARARCSSFITWVLRHTYGWATVDYFRQYFQDGIPEAADYRKAFTDGTGGPHFQRIRKVADLRPGDLIAVDYNGSDPDNTGHIVMVREVKGVYTGTGVKSGETQYAIEIVDMTSAPHGVYGQPSATTHPDTRMVSNVDGADFRGVGIGHMMFYASNTTGEFSRYRWSSYGASPDYDVTARPISAARVV
ncbi:LamG domain-containing protein [Streptomyces ipomoeae]|uniref:LamG domain-containing protein n=1 Tax=Streptomyces ipomoeae TaxID=103232 RepID=A0AAE8W3M3_9ACTN|nr:LamG domain-containing protein [Streptomyces ipomoeae]MDX2931009.1 LamG domain-containing protein [Streptomyces ipomoeae]TQE14657.1 LamG domain-containing protein [Streptomyces ipomoeae]TQE32425.1 LamG domain-containing protein [Streptomyces ipomoeae]